MSEYKIYYNPEPVLKGGKYCLSTRENLKDAIKTANDYASMYYGSISRIWVLQGRKKVYEIPLGAMR